MSWHDMADRALGVAVRTFGHADENGESLVRYFPKSGADYALDAVFDVAHVSIDPATGAQINSTDPILGVQLSQMQAPPQKGDRVRIGGVMYLVSDPQPDGVAGSVLRLKKQ